MHNIFLFLLLSNGFLIPVIYGMEELSPFESEEEYVAFNLEKTKNECLKRGNTILTHITQLKKQRADFSLVELVPLALIEEFDRLRESEKNFVTQILVLPSTQPGDAKKSEKPVQKEPVIESDGPDQDIRKLEEDPVRREPEYMNPTTYCKSKFVGANLVAVPFKRKHSYQKVGCYFKFSLKKPRRRIQKPKSE